MCSCGEEIASLGIGVPFLGKARKERSTIRFKWG